MSPNADYIPDIPAHIDYHSSSWDFAKTPQWDSRFHSALPFIPVSPRFDRRPLDRIKPRDRYDLAQYRGKWWASKNLINEWKQLEDDLVMVIRILERDPVPSQGLDEERFDLPSVSGFT